MTKPVQFPNVLAAVRNAEACRWELGDVLVAGLGPTPTCEVWREVAELTDLDVKLLKRLHRVAASFPPDRRRPVGWSMHEAAENPDVLDAIIEGTPHGKLSLKWVKMVVRGMRLP
jgi:hypothetical protein